MSSLTDKEKLKISYSHVLGKVITEINQEVYESSYKSSHNIKSDEIWSSTISYANIYDDAVAESINNYAVTFYDKVELDMIYGSNGQAYCFISGGTFKDDSYPLGERGQLTSGSTFIRPFISPVDVPDKVTNMPSNGYTLRLFRGSDATVLPDTEIYQTDGNWIVDYYSGIIHFSNDTYNYTPANLGWGTIKASFFQYTGDYGVALDMTFNSGTSQLVINEGKPSQQNIDLVSLSDKISGRNVDMEANDTSVLNPLACNSGITSKPNGSSIRVFVNGIEIIVGIECFFSPDGILERNLYGEKLNDKLYWKYTGNLPVIGYELSSNDRISFLYLTNY